MRLFILLLLAGCTHALPPPIAATLSPPARPPSQLPLATRPWGVPELLDAINTKRRSNGSAPLRIDRGLCVVAERAHAEYRRLGRGAEQRVLGLLNQDLQGFGLSFARTLAAVAVVEEVREATQVLGEAALDPNMAYAGLVVGLSPPPTGPRGGYSVVLALGQ
jgi:hypothetical protein